MKRKQPTREKLLDFTFEELGIMHTFKNGHILTTYSQKA